jgi:hypothetical protein
MNQKTMKTKPANLSKNATIAVAQMLVGAGALEIASVYALERAGVISGEEATGRRIGVRGAVIRQLDEVYYELASEKTRDALRAMTSPGGVVGGGNWVLRETAGLSQMG